MSLLNQFGLARDALALARVRRRSIRIVARTDFDTRRGTILQALSDLGGAIGAHRLALQAITDFARITILPSLKRNSNIRDFTKDIARPPNPDVENPLIGAREAAACLLRSERLRALQGQIISSAFGSWFGLKVNSAQAGVLGSYSDAAWLARGLMQSAGLVEGRDKLSDNDRWRLKVVLEPFVRGLQLRRAHLEGLPDPGRALLAAQVQKRRLLRLKRKGFAPDNLEVLYPEMLDREVFRVRRENIEQIRNQWTTRIETRGTRRRFENYLHLQTLVLGAPSRGPVRLGRYMAAVEQRHA